MNEPIVSKNLIKYLFRCFWNTHKFGDAVYSSSGTTYICKKCEEVHFYPKPEDALTDRREE